MSFFASPMSSYLASLLGLRSESGEPEASSSRDKRPTNTIDDDDDRSIASDIPPSDDGGQDKRRSYRSAAGRSTQTRRAGVSDSDDDEPPQKRPYRYKTGRNPQTQLADRSTGRVSGARQGRTNRGQGPLAPDGRHSASSQPSMCVVGKSHYSPEVLYP